MRNHVCPLAAAVLALSLLAAAQTAYTPQFKGDPAHSTAEAAALGYMRTVIYAQRVYYKKHAAYATSLAELVGSSSFTRRMINPDRGDYTAHFASTNAGKNFSLAMIPKQFDPAHRAFFADDTGAMRVENDQPASVSSPKLKAD
jgi:hypothetical protein